MEKKLERITITLTPECLALMDTFISNDVCVANRSEFIRKALSDYYVRNLKDICDKKK